MNYCKVCGKKLELTPEYDICMECQGKQHITFTLPYNGGVNTNHTEMTAKEVSKIKVAKERFNKMIDILSLEDIDTINQSLTELEAIQTAESDEALEQLEIIREYYDEDGEDEATQDSWDIVKNFILKSQAQERELKKKDELLELYRKLNATQLNYDICDNEPIKSNLMNDIGNLKYVIKCLESEIARRK